MLQPGRHFSSGNYRYGYQGSEKDDELKGEGNSYTTYYRMLDPRIARWKSRDPKVNSFESPYISMSNNPILYNDILGDTIKVTGKGSGKYKARLFFLRILGNKEVRHLIRDLRRDKRTVFINLKEGKSGYLSDRSEPKTFMEWDNGKLNLPMLPMYGDANYNEEMIRVGEIQEEYFKMEPKGHKIPGVGDDVMTTLFPDQHNDFSESMINDFGGLKNVNMSRNKILVHELYHAMRIVEGLIGRLKDGTFIDDPAERQKLEETKASDFVNDNMRKTKKRLRYGEWKIEGNEDKL